MSWKKTVSRTRRLVEKMGGTMRFIRADLTQDSDMEAAVAEAATLGSIKYLANIAGIQHIDSIENFPMERYDYMQRLMVRAPMYMSKLTIPHMKRSSNGTGAVGNMASIHAHICTLNKVSYNIAKFGTQGPGPVHFSRGQRQNPGIFSEHRVCQNRPCIKTGGSPGKTAGHHRAGGDHRCHDGIFKEKRDDVSH